MEGKIKNLVNDKFFGFIQVEGREKDLFFHKNSMKSENPDDQDEKLRLFNALVIGDMVSFDEADSPKGPNAINVLKIEAAE